jgi:nitrite reductase (NADH) large subunit
VSYEDEWKATLEDPEKLRRFASFVNAPTTPDPSLAYVEERGQARPATTQERSGTGVLIAGTTLEVRR